MKLVSRNKQLLIFGVCMVLTVLAGNAQPNLSFYPLDEQFNSSGFNPAFLSSKEKFTFSIFPLGGSSIGFDNQQIIKSLVLGSRSGISTDDDYKNIIERITDRPSFNQNLESTLFTFIFRSKAGYFNFRVKESENFSAAVKGELTNFIFSKDIQSAVIGRVQNLPSQFMHYREYSLGYSSPCRNHKFTAGVRAKVYFGKSAFYSRLSGSVQTNYPDYVINGGGKVNLSIPLTETNVDGKTGSSLALTGSNAISYLMNSGNPGFGLDLGIKYNITPDLMFSFSVIDLGRIDWKTNLNSKVFDGEYLIHSKDVASGLVVNGNEIITKNFDNLSFADTISNRLNQSYERNGFSTQMPVNIYAGFKYQLNSKLKMSMVDRYVYLKNMNYNSLAILASLDVSKEIAVNTGYTAVSNSFYNIPLAVLFKKEWGQIYFGTENMLFFIVPSFSDFAGFTFGTCFYLFKNKGHSNSTSEDYPFYRPRKAKRNQKTGLITKEVSEN